MYTKHVHSQIFQLQICLICDGFQNGEKFEQHAPPSKQIKKRTMCPSWIFRGQPGWNPILALCISHTWWCASPLHPQLITTRRLRTNLSKDTIHLLIIRRGRDCIPTTDCAAIIHNTEPQPRTNNEGLCRNVKQSPSTYPCQWVSQWVIDSFRFWRWLSHLQGLQASFCLFLNSQFLKVKVKCLIKTGIVGILLGSQYKSRVILSSLQPDD